jgi:hypothetical protein
MRKKEAAVQIFDLAEKFVCSSAALFIRLGKTFEEKRIEETRIIAVSTLLPGLL